MATAELPELFAGIKSGNIDDLVLSSGVYERELAEPGYLAEISGLATSAGLRFASAHGLWSANNDLNWPDENGRKAMVNAQKRYMAVAAEYGCRTFVVHPGVSYMRYDPAKLWKKVRLSVEELLETAEKYRIILALENNVHWNLGMDCGELADFIRSFDSPFLGGCFDTGHANAVGDVLAAAQKFAPVAVTAHLHDNDGSGDQHRMPGNGTIPWDKLMKLFASFPQLYHVESEPAGMDSAEKILEAVKIYRILSGVQ